MRSVFLSDLHLDEGRPQITRLFIDYIVEQHGVTDRLYILGDLFEAWIGDDHITSLARDVAETLERLAAGGTEIYFIRGNRDFLIGQDYAHQCRMTILEDPTIIDIHGRPAIIGHGDLWCTDDHAYQALRSQVRDPAWQRSFLERTIEDRTAFALEARARSRAHNAESDETIMDVNSGAIARAFADAGVDLMIHGHTHRPAIHTLAVDGGNTGTRIVLGDWYRHGSVLEWEDDAFDLRILPVS